MEMDTPEVGIIQNISVLGILQESLVPGCLSNWLFGFPEPSWSPRICKGAAASPWGLPAKQGPWGTKPRLEPGAAEGQRSRHCWTAENPDNSRRTLPWLQQGLGWGKSLDTSVLETRNFCKNQKIHHKNPTLLCNQPQVFVVSSPLPPCVHY